MGVFIALLSLPSAYAQNGTLPKKHRLKSPRHKTAKKIIPLRITGIRMVTLVPKRVGSYSYWISTPAGATQISSIVPSQSSVKTELPADARQIAVVDDSNGTLALYDATKMPNGLTLPLHIEDFKRIRNFTISVTSGGRPVEKAIITLKSAKNGEVKKHVLTAVDQGSFRFENVLIGSATATASYNRQSISGNITIAPAKMGETAGIALELKDPAAPVLDRVSSKTAPANPKKTTADAKNTATTDSKSASADKSVPTGTEKPDSDKPASANPLWAGLLGIAVLGALLFWGIKQAVSRNVTVPDMLRKMGAEMPQDAEPTPPSRYQRQNANPPAEASPLESLSNLPSANVSPQAAPVFDSAHGIPPVPVSRIRAIAGTQNGRDFELPTDPVPMEIGREPDRQIALVGDGTVSRLHAQIVQSGSGYYIQDLDSSNGTFVNGVRVKQQTLQRGDIIQVGESRFQVEA